MTQRSFSLSLSLSLMYHAWENTKQNPRGSTLCFAKKSKRSNFPKALLYDTAFTYSCSTPSDSLPSTTITKKENEINVKVDFVSLHA